MARFLQWEECFSGHLIENSPEAIPCQIRAGLEPVRDDVSASVGTDLRKGEKN